MLVLRGATYRYAGYARPVIHDVDLGLADGEIVGLVGANEAGKSTICLVASGLAPASIGGGLDGHADDRRPARGGPAGVRARRAGRDRLPEPDDAALRGHRHRLRGGGPGADEPGPAGRRDLARARQALGGPAPRGAGRARPGPPLGRPGPARGDRVAHRDAAAPHRPRRADGPAGPGGDAPGRRGAPRAGGDRDRAARSRSTRRTCSTGCATGSLVVDEGRIVLDGPAGGGPRRRAAGASGAWRRRRASA